MIYLLTYHAEFDNFQSINYTAQLGKIGTKEVNLMIARKKLLENMPQQLPKFLLEVDEKPTLDFDQIPEFLEEEYDKEEKFDPLQQFSPFEDKEQFLKFINNKEKFKSHKIIHMGVHRKQVGQTCKIVATLNLLDFLYQNGKIDKLPPPTYKNELKKSDTRTAQIEESARYIAKTKCKSAVGELYNEHMIYTLIKEIGVSINDQALTEASTQFQRFKGVDKFNQYIQYIQKKIDENTPSIIFYDMDDIGFPLINGSGKREHAAMVVGYALAAGREGLYFIMAHSGGYYTVHSKNLMLSSNNLDDFRNPETFVKVKISDQNYKRWFCISTSHDALLDLLRENFKEKAVSILCQKINKLKDNGKMIFGKGNILITKRIGKNISDHPRPLGFRLTVCTIYPNEYKLFKNMRLHDSLPPPAKKTPEKASEKMSPLIQLRYRLWNCDPPVYSKKTDLADLAPEKSDTSFKKYKYKK